MFQSSKTLAVLNRITSISRSGFFKRSVMLMPMRCSSSVSRSRNRDRDPLFEVVDIWKDKPAGLFSQVFNTRVSYADLFESPNMAKNLADAEGYKAVLKLVGCIAGADGVSAVERALCIKALKPWFGDCDDATMDQILDEGASMPAEQAMETRDVLDDVFGEEVRNAVVLFSLCCASADGLGTTEQAAFSRVCDHIGISRATAEFLFETFEMEVELKRRYESLESQ